MCRYVSIHWNPHERPVSDGPDGTIGRLQELVQCSGMSQLLRAPGLSLYVAPARSTAPVMLGAGSGAIVGTIFRRARCAPADCPVAVRKLEPAEMSRVLRSSGRSLIDEFWGSYVAILSSCGNSSSLVLRGPLARLKCLHAEHRGIHFFFSHIEDFAALQLGALTINWDTICAQAAGADYIGRQTAIDEIDAIAAGECIRLTWPQPSRAYYWNPCIIGSDLTSPSLQEAARELYHETRLCVRAWATHYNRVLHRISGGLDSAISASCCRSMLSRSDLICLTRYFGSFNGDERKFARSVSRWIDVALIENERSTDLDWTIFSRCTRTAWPMPDFSSYGAYEAEVELARNVGAKAIFCGNMGDSLFENEASRDAATDYVWRHGMGRDLLRVALDNAHRLGFSVWKVLARSAPELWTRTDPERWDSLRVLERTHGLHVRDISLLRPEILDRIEAGRDRLHRPWMDHVDGVPPAKFRMILAIGVHGANEVPFARKEDPPIVTPLASQPLVELCLRIPTYLNGEGGIDRAVARRAFQGRIPDLVAFRTSKGSPESWTREVIRRNQPFLRSFLLEGILCAKHILAPERVSTAISSAAAGSRAYTADLIQQLHIEAWLRQWHGAESPAASSARR